MVFISYSHIDEVWKDKIVKQLSVLANDVQFKLWDDRQIAGGDDWLPEIEKAIQSCSVALLLISEDFHNSKFIMGSEVLPLLKRRERDGVRVIPIIVRHCAWDEVSWLSSMQARPKDGKPLSSMSVNDAEEALAALTREIKHLLKAPSSGPSDQPPPPTEKFSPTIVRAIPQPFPARWASGYGEDEYGVWHSFTVNNVRQKMRWINPGTFMKGSPKGEYARESTETQETVDIPDGFWLAETACTQEMWQEVMGWNLSEHRENRNNPVERVDWDESQAFIRKLNNINADLDIRLPSGMEMEYARRAGTTSAFNLGPNITTRQVNYDGAKPYNGGEMGEERDTTLPVKCFPCNEWGLFEMHGNVMEWCSDIAGYVSDKDFECVLSGGDYRHGADHCRSAYRHIKPYTTRVGNFGFRIARSQKVCNKIENVNNISQLVENRVYLRISTKRLLEKVDESCAFLISEQKPTIFSEGNCFNNNKYNHNLLQTGHELVIQTADLNTLPNSIYAISIGNFESNSMTIRIHYNNNCSQNNLDSDPTTIDMFANEKFLLVTDDYELTLEKISKPLWSISIGRENEGLYVILPDKRRLNWCDPNSYSVTLKGTIKLIDIEKGFWWDEKSNLDWQNNIFGSLDWADECGIDEYGIYADFSIKNIKQRMRWVWPGEFEMGSPDKGEVYQPDGDPERFVDEKQHSVIISRGFWIADTTCTQELWNTVMARPSPHLNDKLLPIVEVNWKDCDEFCTKINRMKNGLNLRMPTEAEWEYACRAGSKTPFSFGVNITSDQVNCHFRTPYKDLVTVNRDKAVKVKSFPCNSWGLYEMHGNVWEWCHDWYNEDYPTDTVDPKFLEEDSYRILRGGSWYFETKDSRSASRYSLRPNNRKDYVGFRFTRNQ